MILGVGYSTKVSAKSLNEVGKQTRIEQNKTKAPSDKVFIKKQNKDAELIGLKANSDLGYTRIVLELKNREASWDVNYNQENDTLEVVLPNTMNKVTNSTIKQRKGAVLKNITMEQYNDGSLHLLLQANQAVQHNLFVLENPERLVIDLFTNYSQKIEKNISDDLKFIQWDRSIDAGRLRVYIAKADIGANFMRESNINGVSLGEWQKQTKASVIIPLDSKKYYKNDKKKWYLMKNNQGWNLYRTAESEDKGINLPGISVLEKGKYIGPKGFDGEMSRPSTTFVGVDNKGNLYSVLIEGGVPASVGASMVESAKILKELGIENAICIARTKNAQWILKDKI